MKETRASYVAEWSTKTGKPTREIYVPIALRPSNCWNCGWTEKVIAATVDVDGPGNHINCSYGRW